MLVSKLRGIPWDFLSNDGFYRLRGAGGTTSKSLVDLEEGDGTENTTLAREKWWFSKYSKGNGTPAILKKKKGEILEFTQMGRFMAFLGRMTT